MSYTRRPTETLAGLCAILAVAVLAATPAPGLPPLPGDRPLDADLFPPDLVMRFQAEIELTPEQSRSILSVAQETQSAMLEVQWKLGPELEKLRGKLSMDRIDEDEVRELLAGITQSEHRAKELQVLLMVRVKNLLSPEQQERLRELRPDSPRRR